MKVTAPPGEIALSLWYVFDEDGLIYRVLARLQFESGSEADILRRLQAKATRDYLIASQSELPRQFHTTIHEGRSAKTMPVLPVSAYHGLPPLSIFEDAIKQLESDLPGFSPLEVSQDPIVSITPLLMTEAGDLQPQISDNVRFDEAGGWPHGKK